MKTLSSIQLNVSYLNIIVNKKPCTKGWKLHERESKKKYIHSVITLDFRYLFLVVV